jgi:glycosyltransferase involved in cell wall biosynthesis
MLPADLPCKLELLTVRVLMLTRRVDKNDWLAGFAHGWAAALGGRVERLYIICLEKGTVDLPANVTVESMGKERGYGRLREILTFWRATAAVIRDVDVIFGHMIPRYTLVAAPWALAFGVPMVQWYTHRQVTLELRIAHALAQHVVTASPESFQLPSDKLTVLGHGIDTAAFSPALKPPETRIVVAVGRLSPIKHYETLIEASALLLTRPGFQDVRIEIAGGVTPQDGEPYARHLKALAHEQGLEGRVTFLGPVPHRDIPALYRRAFVAANLCPTGGVDKAVLEAMACGVPTVVRNRAFSPILGPDVDVLLCTGLGAGAVADRLAALLSLSSGERAALGQQLRARVLAGYDLGSLMDRLVAVLERAAASRQKTGTHRGLTS